MRRALRPRSLVLLLVIVAAGVAAWSLTREDGLPPPGEPAVIDPDAADPFLYDEARRAEFERRAAAGSSHVLYAKSPGGVLATTQRTAVFRAQVESAAPAAGVEPDILEAIVFLESAGRPDAVADAKLEGAVGLTQILAETGRNLLAMRVDPAAARKLSRRIRRAERRGQTAAARRLRARRSQVDERFDPVKSLQATARYLTFALGRLGRPDLAVASYHMGVGNLENVIADFRRSGSEPRSYAQLYFGSSPRGRPAPYRRLLALGDDSSTYLWRVLAAREIMRLLGEDPAELDRRAELQTAKNSAEEVLHPLQRSERFATPGKLRAAYRRGRIVALPLALLARRGIQVDTQMGELARRIGGRARTYRGLRPGALALLEYLGAGVKAISKQQPLVLTSTVRDQRYQRVLISGNREATRNYSLHTTGWAFDILRSYRSRRQGLAFEYMLGRLQSYDLIAWVREPAAIHVTVSSRADELVGRLDG